MTHHGKALRPRHCGLVCRENRKRNELHENVDVLHISLASLIRASRTFDFFGGFGAVRSRAIVLVPPIPCYDLISSSLQAKTMAERSPILQAFKLLQYREHGIFVDSLYCFCRLVILLFISRSSVAYDCSLAIHKLFSSYSVATKYLYLFYQLIITERVFALQGWFFLTTYYLNLLFPVERERETRRHNWRPQPNLDCPQPRTPVPRPGSLSLLPIR